MKKIFLFSIVSLLTLSSFAQKSYEVKTDSNGDKELVGKIDEKLLINDEDFSWFYQGINKYKPETEWLKYITHFRDSVDIVVFAGTWNVNSQSILPAFYRTMINAGYPLNKITLYGVDENLKALNDESLQYAVKKLPTIIVMRGVNEIGRIEEVPNSSVEENLVAILQRAFMSDQLEDQ